MITLCTDKNNDLCVELESLVIAEDLAAVLQACEQAAKTQLGEIYLNTQRGVPNFSTIWTSGANIAQFESYMRRILLSVPDVTGIKSLTTEIRDQSVVYYTEIESIHGNGVITNGL